MSEDLEHLMNRYNRQELIAGWDQSKLENASIAIIGTDILANFSAITLAALGFGDIEIYGPGFVTRSMLTNYGKNRNNPDYSEGFLYFDAHAGDPKAEVIASFIKKLNPLVDAFGVNIDLCRAENRNVIGKPDIILETTNDPASKIVAIEYAAQHNIPLVSMSSSSMYAGVGFFDPRSNREDMMKLIENIVFAELKGMPQGTTTSQVIAGVGVDEVRKKIMPLRNERIIEDIVVYNMDAETRFERNGTNLPHKAADFKEKTVAMIGAGALGNFAGLDLVLNNVGHLYVVDFDEIESTNLNRQIWFYDAVGRNKAEALIEKLRKINPRVEFSYAKERIIPDSKNFFKKTDIDLMIDTVDNNKTRALLNYFSLRYKIPFISGGTRHNSGQATIAIPGKTGCLNCQADIDKLALDGYQPHSCIYAPEPSVITSNQIAAGFIGGEARTVLQPDIFGEPIHHILKYVSDETYRLGVLPSNGACNCHKNRVELMHWTGKMKHLYEGD